MSLTWQLLPPWFKKVSSSSYCFVFHEKHLYFVLLERGAAGLETSSGTCTGSY